MKHDLILNDFSDFLEHPFPVSAGELTLSLVLVETKEVPGGLPGGRQPFTLLFRGPARPRLPQATYDFDHPKHGALSIFIVPVGADAEGTLYEAVFS